jgi:hypothetical protein
MTVKLGALALASRRVDAQSPEHEERVRQKRLVASVRRPTFGTQGVTTVIPGSPGGLSERIGQTRRGADLLGAGWQPALVDLRHICAMMPLAHLDVELPELEADDLEALAKLVFAGEGAELRVDYDREASGWIVHEATEDVQVIGQFRAAGSPGAVLGLAVGHSPSFIEVARLPDRFVLVHGYDLAVSLLARGIHSVPALVHGQVQPADLHFGDSSLEQEAVLGRRPPLLPDFLDNDVSAEVLVPRTRRVLMVRATEFDAY